MKRRLLLLIIAFLPLIAFGAKKQFTNAEEAKQIFDKVYQMVFGPQGARLHYDVNIIIIVGVVVGGIAMPIFTMAQWIM